MFKSIKTSAGKADTLINQTFRHLVNAVHTAELAVEHAAKAVATHDAAIVFHHEKQAAAAALQSEASTVLSEAKSLLGHDVVPVLEHVAEQVVADAATNEVK